MIHSKWVLYSRQLLRRGSNANANHFVTRLCLNYVIQLTSIYRIEEVRRRGSTFFLFTGKCQRNETRKTQTYVKSQENCE